MLVDFRLSDTPRPWTSDRTGVKCDFYIGEGSSALEVVVAKQDNRPTKQRLERLYKDRRGGRANPILVVVLYENGSVASVCGPAGEEPPVKRGLDPEQVQRICNTALNKPNRNAAQRFLRDILDQIDDDMVGLRNQGLLSTHELKVGVPDRPDWDDATARAREILDENSRDLIAELGYEIERLSDQSHLLKDVSDSRETAVAIFLQDDESFDRAQDRFTGQSPVSYALNEADKKNLDYVIANSNNTLRLYTTNPDAGFGSRGRTDTFVEANTDLLTEDDAGYLWLLFSAEALRDGGTLDQIMGCSKDYAASLGKRLRERIYDEVVPDLAEAIANARQLDNPTKAELDETYRMALILLYRLLFISYAEDEGFLPRYNPRYERRSLKRKAHEVHEIIEEDIGFDSRSTTHWDDVMALSRAIHNGHGEWGLPEYDGTLLSEDSSDSNAGAMLAGIELADEQFGPVLANLLVDETGDGYEGPIDFRNVGVREFGVIYEGLLESELSYAEQPLGLDSDGHYRPVDPDNHEVEVKEGKVYLHGQSGERKATGTYYTKKEFVEHVLDNSLDPALDDHLEQLDEMSKNEAAKHFFDIRIADIAMGSGHFLVGAVDRIESRLSNHLTERNLPLVEEELDRLRDAAEESFETTAEMPEVERSQLLRRQVARRCIYGVDLNDLATELSRLSLWIHTFVPGLPLTFLDYNLRAGDSIIGISSLDEVDDIIDIDQKSLGQFIAGGSDALEDIQQDIARIGRMADGDASEVQEARETRKKIEENLEQTKAAFDILLASQIDDRINPNTSTLAQEDITSLSSYKYAQQSLGSIEPVHFPVMFPEIFEGNSSGFDAIVGNPPWDKVRFEAQQFWVTRHPGINSLGKAKRKQKIEELRQQYPYDAEVEEREKEERERYQDYVKAAYDDQGRGHYDYSKLFVERATDILNSDGKLGYVLPRQSLILGGWKQLRRRLFKNSELTVLQARNQGGWIFDDVHKSYMVVLLTRKPASGKPGAYIWPAIGSEKALKQASFKNSLHLSVDDLANLTTKSHLVIPWFNSNKAREIFPKLQECSRLSSDDGWVSGVNDSRWDFTSSGPHGSLTKDKLDSGLWKVFMTRSVEQFELNEEKEFRRYVDPKDLHRIDGNIIESEGKIAVGPNHPTVSFRYVSTNSNRRTMIATMLPESDFMYCKGYIHAIDHSEGTEPETLFALLAYVNSFTCDWWVRRISNRHVMAPVINNLPIPDWTDVQIAEAAEIAAEITRRGGIETIPGGHEVEQFSGYEYEDENTLRARIERLVADGFDLSGTHIETVLDDFSDKACPVALTEAIDEEMED
ncbi:Eco57I restriction-modification methylase domain-containing protein [Natronorarus salvus]|uniref:Eco57I restriction-modification methylase domain-containing protein n=1 Tax=Natronorarus salvus TaxID=3117733 RepID=UPI002F262D3B